MEPTVSTESHDRKPLISVVTAMYGGDAAGFLRESVESTLMQTYPRLELVLAIDGPLPDVLESLVDEFARDERVRVVRLAENRGPAAARNAAIAAAQGDLIAILDADDVSVPDRLLRQEAFLWSNDADVVGSWYALIDGSGRKLGERHLPLFDRDIRRRMPVLNAVANSTVLARREVLLKHPYPEDLRYGEDYALWIALLRAGYKIVNQPECLVRFRQDPQFAGRRRGWSPFTSDLRNKWRALPVAAAWERPVLAAAGVCVAAGRLLPAWLLDWGYGLRRTT
jgi:glycosyltransferase involved in cell wall biosynthesis